MPGGRGLGAERRQREDDGERRARARSGALAAHRAAVQLDDVAHDREPDAEPAVRARGRRVVLAEALEDVRQKVRVDTGAGVVHDQLQVRVDSSENDVHASAFGRELDGVREQVPHHLLQALVVAGDDAGARVERRVQADGLGVGGGLQRFDRRLDGARELDRTHLEAYLAGDDARDVEQILDQPRLRTRRALDRRDALLERCRVERAHAEQRRPREDRRERRAQLVGDGSEELVLGAVGALSVLRRGARLRQQLLALALGTHALGDVAQDDGIELLARDRALRDPRLHRELLAVGAERDQHPLAAHLTHADSRLAELADVGVVVIAEARGDETIDGLADRVRRRTAEDLLGTGAEERDALRLVDGDDRVGRGAEDRCQALSTELQRDALGDVAEEDRKARVRRVGMHVDPAPGDR